MQYERSDYLTLTINGTNVVPYIAQGGIKWQREDVDGPNAGRGLDGTLIRDRVATKRRLDVTCKPLTLAEASTVLNLIEPEWITVVYTDPMAGENLTKQMYSNNIPATFALIQSDGTEMWSGITFPLVEK